MLNVATSSAIPAKTVRNVVIIPRKSPSMSLSCSSVTWAPVRTSTSPGTTSRTRVASSSCDTPGSALASTDVTRPVPPVM